MVRVCLVCKKNAHNYPHLTFHSFPTQSEKKGIWLVLLGFNADQVLPKRPELCSEHFEVTDFQYRHSGRKFLNRDVLPKPYNSGYHAEFGEGDVKTNMIRKYEKSENGANEKSLLPDIRNNDSHSAVPCTVKQTASSKTPEEQLNVEVNRKIEETAKDIGQTTPVRSTSMEEQLSKKIKLEIEEATSQTTNEQLLLDPCETILIKEEPLNESSSPIDDIDSPTEKHPEAQCSINSLDCMSRLLVEQNKDYRDMETLFIDIRLLDATINRLNAYRGHLTNRLEEFCSDQIASQKNAENQIVTPDEVIAKDVDKGITISVKSEVEEIEMEDAEIVPVNLDPDEKAVVLQNAGEQLIVGTNFGNIYYTKVEDRISFHRKIKVTNCAITAIQLVNDTDHDRCMFIGAMDCVLRMYSFQWGSILVDVPLKASVRCIDSMWNFVFIGCSNGIYCRLSQKKKKVEFVPMKSKEDILVLKATQEGTRQVLIVGQRDSPIVMLDAFSGFLIRKFVNVVVSTVHSIALDGRRFFCGSAHYGILKYTFQTHSLEKVLQKGAASISCLKIVENKLFAGCLDGHIYVFGLNSGNIHILKGRAQNITCMEITNDKIIVGSSTRPVDSIPIPEDIIAET